MQRELRIELGRMWLTAADVGRLGVGSRIELDASADEDAVIWAGGRRIAAAQALVRDGNLCVRVCGRLGGRERQTAPAAAGIPPTAAAVGGWETD